MLVFKLLRDLGDDYSERFLKAHLSLLDVARRQHPQVNALLGHAKSGALTVTLGGGGAQERGREKGEEAVMCLIFSLNSVDVTLRNSL